MDVDLAKLNQLLVIARTGSFSRAAEELRITQPALSRSVAGLEQRFGFRIFERGRGGATPTTVGALVLALMIGGVIVGGIAAWLRQRKWRRAARRAQAQARDLRAEVDRLKRRMGEVPADPVAAGYAPRLTIPPPAA